MEHYSREKTLVAGETERRGITVNDNNTMMSINKFTEMENVLLGLDLYEYLRVFNDHNVGLTEFLLMRENDLEAMGIDKVGARKKLMEGQAEIHKKDWEKSSMPRLGMEDRRVGLRLTCPDATGIMANISQHSRFVCVVCGC